MSVEDDKGRVAPDLVAKGEGGVAIITGRDGLILCGGCAAGSGTLLSENRELAEEGHPDADAAVAKLSGSDTVWRGSKGDSTPSLLDRVDSEGNRWRTLLREDTLFFESPETVVEAGRLGMQVVVLLRGGDGRGGGGGNGATWAAVDSLEDVAPRACPPEHAAGISGEEQTVPSDSRCACIFVVASACSNGSAILGTGAAGLPLAGLAPSAALF